MKHIIKILSVFILFISSAATQKTPPATLDIMSFNIRYGTANDGENSWPYRNVQLIEMIRKSSPDLIGFQEVLKFQLDELMAALPDYAMIGVSREGNWEDEFSAIFYKKSILSPRKTNTYWLSDTPEMPSKGWGNEIMRIVTWAEFKHIPSNRLFYLFNAHFDHISQPSRLKGARQLINRVNDRDHPYPVIITGDFNAGEENEAIKGIKSAGFNDTYRKMHPNEAVVGTFNGFTGENEGEKIDYVFVNDHIEVLEANIDRSNINGRYPSDHYPVTTKIKLLN